MENVYDSTVNWACEGWLCGCQCPRFDDVARTRSHFPNSMDPRLLAVYALSPATERDEKDQHRSQRSPTLLAGICRAAECVAECRRKSLPRPLDWSGLASFFYGAGLANCTLTV